MATKPTYFSEPNYRGKREFAALIKESIRKEHGNIKGLRVTWHWFKARIAYPSGLKGTTAQLTVCADEFNPKTFLMTATYKPNGDFYWRIF